MNDLDDHGSITITRMPADMVRVRVRSPGSMTVNEVTLPFDDWRIIAIPPEPAKPSGTSER